MAEKIATYKLINESGGSRYQFFCDLSGARVFNSAVITPEADDKALQKAWEEAKGQFNRCEKCGRFVCDAMYNADTFMCVDCSPWENPPKFCKHCGQPVSFPDTFCRNCGSVLRYKEE